MSPRASSRAEKRGLTVSSYPGFTPRLVRKRLIGREDRAAYEAVGGYAAGGARGQALIEEVETAGLRGRGGAAFPTGAKLRACSNGPGPRYVVANGAEGEPASIKDRWLLRNRPHLVLEGVALAAEAIGADRAFVVAADRAAIASAERAIVEREDDDLQIEVVVVEPRYVAGEETAVVRAIGGGPAKPTAKPPRPFEAGVHAQPTFLSNVETLANLPFIAVRGAAAFRSLGTASSPGTFLLTLSGDCDRPGLYEVPLGVELADAISAVGSHSPRPAGYLMGGFFAGLLGPRAARARLCYDELRAHESGLGCGAVVVLSEDDCVVAAAADLMAYFARENAQQCGACINGTAGMTAVLEALARGSATSGDVERLRGWSTSLRGRGACALLDGAAGLAASLLREFPEHVAAHVDEPRARCVGGPAKGDAGRLGVHF